MCHVAAASKIQTLMNKIGLSQHESQVNGTETPCYCKDRVRAVLSATFGSLCQHPHMTMHRVVYSLSIFVDIYCRL